MSLHAKKGLLPYSPEFVEELRVWLGKRNGQEKLGRRMCGGSNPLYWTEPVPCTSRLAPACVLAWCRAGCAEKLHADDTLVPVLALGLGKTKTGRLWTYVRDDQNETSPRRDRRIADHFRCSLTAREYSNSLLRLRSAFNLNARMRTL